MTPSAQDARPGITVKAGRTRSRMISVLYVRRNVQSFLRSFPRRRSYPPTRLESLQAQGRMTRKPRSLVSYKPAMLAVQINHDSRYCVPYSTSPVSTLRNYAANLMI
ncbi:hypothetical protein FS749_002511 [Ceratobasidium sp. UAMH 11750]|nr:hypothetical protein FS749_002511 [Ceratobasidium sp. UAMH 11750]